MAGRRWRYAAVVGCAMSGLARAQGAEPPVAPVPEGLPSRTLEPGALVADGFQLRAGLRGSTVQGLGLLLAAEYATSRFSIGVAPALNLYTTTGLVGLGSGGIPLYSSVHVLQVRVSVPVRFWLAPRRAAAMGAFVSASVGASASLPWGQPASLGLSGSVGMGLEYLLTTQLGLTVAAEAVGDYAFGSGLGPGAALLAELGAVFHL